MAVLRLFLFFALIYYGIRLVAKWLLSGAGEGKRPSGMSGKTGEKNYKDLTDQTIEDADYEELQGEP